MTTVLSTCVSLSPATSRQRDASGCSNSAGPCSARGSRRRRPVPAPGETTVTCGSWPSGSRMPFLATSPGSTISSERSAPATPRLRKPGPVWPGRQLTQCHPERWRRRDRRGPPPTTSGSSRWPVRRSSSALGRPGRRQGQTKLITPHLWRTAPDGKNAFGDSRRR